MIRYIALSAGVAGATLASPAYAQNASTSAAPDLPEVVVTAQRREAPLADTPVSVVVAAQPLLAEVGVRDIKDLTLLTPGLLVASTSNETYTTARIRGVGTVGDNPGLESSVVVVIDGVTRARNGVALGDLGEIARIEVIRGPQNTLFGQNATAGVIHVVTAPPSFEPAFGGEITVGDHGTRGGSAFATGPLSDILAGRLYASVRRRDGFYAVRTGDGPRAETEDQDQAYETVRGQLMLVPDDRLTLRLSADMTHRDENCCVGVQLSTGSTQALLALMAPDGGVAQPADPWARSAWSNRETRVRIRDAGVSLHAEWDAGWGKVSAITAYRQWRAALSQDWDFTSADLAYRPNDGRWSNGFRTFSQEIRLEARRGRVDHLVGAYFANEQLLRRDSLLYGTDYEEYVGRLLSRSTAQPLGRPAYVSELTGLPVGTNFVEGLGLDDTYAQEARTVAVFAQPSLRLTDVLTLTAGLRYTDVEKSVDARYANTDGGSACAAALARGVNNAVLCLPWSNPAFNNLERSEAFDESGLTGTARIEYRPRQGLLAYAAWSRGRKSGGFNLDRTQTAGVPDPSTAFPAETVDATEIGLKGEWLNRRLLVSGSAYRQTYQDFQLNTFLGTTFLVRSIPEVRAKGAELDLIARPSNELSFQAGVAYGQTEYRDAPVGGLPLLAGARLSFAPLWSGSAAATWERPVAASLALRGTLAARYASDYNTGSDLDPAKVQPAFWLVDGRLTLLKTDGSWSVSIWARNLLDTDYRQVAFGAPFQTGTIGAFLAQPRTIGFSLRWVSR